MCEILENDKSGLMLFYGDPGTGKTSLIKHFISKYEDKDFIFMDGELLVNASKEKLMAYFLECQDTIFILEDCEKALLNRERNYNPVMSILLNLTDGIIGDVLNINGNEYQIPNYSSVDLTARPQYFYVMSQGNMVGDRFYGIDVVGGNLKLRPAKRINDNVVCVVNMFTAHDYTNSDYILGPVNPTH
jgi:hypothetical protein